MENKTNNIQNLNDGVRDNIGMGTGTYGGMYQRK